MNSLELNTSYRNAEVVCVGAGPIGLLSAISIKLLNPEINIALEEKHESYQRKHILTLKKDSFKNLPKNEKLNSLLSEIFPGKKTEAAYLTAKLEKRLKAIAESLSIQVIQNKVSSTTDLLNRYENMRVLVGSDGSHSLIRQENMGALKQQKDLQYIVEAKYFVQGRAKAASFFSHAYPAMKEMGFTIEEKVGKYDQVNDQTPITLIFFVDKKLYDEISPHATFQEPITSLRDDHIPKKLKKALNLWINLKQRKKVPKFIPKDVVKAKEGPIKQFRLTTTRLQVYKSKKFSKTINSGKTKVAVVGDAGSGVPFFRGLNKGIKESALLAKAVTASEKGQKDAFKNYEKSMHRLSNFEILVAKVKNFFLSALRFFVNISRRVPWQLNRIDKKFAKEMKSKSPMVA